MAKKIDWNAIKMEYITSNATQRELAAKYGCTLRQLSTHSTKEGWVKLREAHFNEVATLTQQNVTEQQALQLSDVVFGFDCLAGTILDLAKDKMQTCDWKEAKDAMSTLQSLIPMFKELHNIKDDNDDQNIVISFKREGDDFYG